MHFVGRKRSWHFGGGEDVYVSDPLVESIKFNAEALVSNVANFSNQPLSRAEMEVANHILTKKWEIFSGFCDSVFTLIFGWKIFWS